MSRLELSHKEAKQDLELQQKLHKLHPLVWMSADFTHLTSKHSLLCPPRRGVTCPNYQHLLE